MSQDYLNGFRALLVFSRNKHLDYFKIFRPEYYEKYHNDLNDPFGYKMGTLAKYEPVFQFFFNDYFKIKISGLENVPSQGPALLIGNHSGMLPVDAVMMTMAMCRLHSNPRRVRYLITDWFFQIPGLCEWMMETGQVRASIKNGEVLADMNEIIGLYPEGIRGVGKPVSQKYRIIDFHPGFVKLAITKQLPIIPVVTLGGDETYMVFKNSRRLSRLLKMPFFPFTPMFPWFPFPLMFMPLPIRWKINVLKPIHLNIDPSQANNRRIILDTSKEIQFIVQKELNSMYSQRKSIFQVD